jgi:hypothetical protein
MRINVYRVRYFLSSEMDKQSAESSLLKQIGQAFLDKDLQSAAKLKDYLAAGHWPTQRVTTGLYTDLIAAESQQKAVAALPPVPEGQLRTIDQVHTEIEGAFLAVNPIGKLSEVQ